LKSVTFIQTIDRALQEKRTHQFNCLAKTRIANHSHNCPAGSVTWDLYHAATIDYLIKYDQFCIYDDVTNAKEKHVGIKLYKNGTMCVAMW